VVRRHAVGRQTVILAAVACAVLGACRPRHSFGSYSKLRNTLLGSCNAFRPESDDVRDVYTCELDRFDDSDKDRIAVFECPCRGNMTFHTKGDDVVRIDLTLEQCTRQVASTRIRLALDRFLDAEQQPKLDARVAHPDGDRSELQGLTSKHVYGDVTVDMNWSRDSYPKPPPPSDADKAENPVKALDLDRLAVASDQESYHLALSFHQGSDVERDETSTKQNLMPQPACLPP
jgi:hypothetical protein